MPLKYWPVSIFGALLLNMATPQAQAADAPPPLLTGEVYSLEAQELIVPLTNNWQSRISKMLPEGTFVNTGDVVVEFDGTEAATQLEQQRETERTEQARTERDIARLQKEVTQALFKYEQAMVSLDLATLKADIPQGVIGAIEYAENQLGYEQAVKSLENATKERNDRQRRLAERQRQAELDAEKMALQEQWWSEMLESFVIRADQPGFVIYGNHPWTRAKFQDGDTVRTSFKVAQVANTEEMAVKIWINGVDRPSISAGDQVKVMLDALGGEVLPGHIESLSDSGTQRREWGKADYFEGIVLLDQKPDGALLPGMSALVEVVQ